VSKRRHRPRKRFGQNFLYDPAIAGRIVAAAELKPNQAVVELGAGRGIMTGPLIASGARVIALEIDRDLCSELAEKLPFDGRRAELLNADLTEVSLTSLLVERGIESCVLMGNIPYYLTREVLFAYLVDEHEMIEAAVLMMQREVGERIVSPPGSRVYGITSVILQSLYEVKTLFKVAPGSFNPAPKVASVVLEFKPLAAPLAGGDELRPFVRLVKNLFQQRRKTIQNTIKNFYALSEEEMADLEQTTGIDTGRRPESLKGDEFLTLSRALDRMTSAG